MRRNPFEKVKQALDRAESQAVQVVLDRAGNATSSAGMVVAGGSGPSGWVGFWQLGIGALGGTAALG